MRCGNLEGKVTVRKLLKMKGREKIVMITAYDEPSARLADEAGVDSILVGDSLGMVVLGYENTLKVTMGDMIRHTAAVARARPRALVVADMPFGSYEVSQSKAVENAVELARVGAEAVKLEGGSEYTDVIRAIVRAGIPVVGHVGLTPQRFLRLGGYRMVGKRDDEARLILDDAAAVEDAGAFALVIEYTNPDVARRITEKLSIPTICIGSGPHCDGQVLVLHDVVGLARLSPPFAKRYANAAEVIRKAIEDYAREVREGVFP